MNVTVLLITFAAILPIELPDKTLIATLVLSTKYRPWPVWIGSASAFLIQCAVAVLAGDLLTLLPKQLVRAVVALLFAIGAALLVRSVIAGEDESEIEEEEEEEIEARLAREAKASDWRRQALVSFGVLFAAEWGDVSQLATATLQARYHARVEVFLGSWAALAGIGALAVVAGRQVLRVVPLRLVRIVAAVLFTAFALVSIYEAISA